MPKKKLPPEILNYFREQGRRGGKKAARIMTRAQRVARATKASQKATLSLTPEERRARALKAVAAREAKRKKARSKPIGAVLA